MVTLNSEDENDFPNRKRFEDLRAVSQENQALLSTIQGYQLFVAKNNIVYTASI